MTAAQFLNQHSFLMTASVLLGGWLVFLLARRPRRAVWAAWVAAVALAFGVFFRLRTAAPHAFETADDVERAISSGRPTLVEFYSDF